jgi:spermidine synthase
MISDADEFVYHELMAHIPSMVVPELKQVLIIGGGDGGIVREFCKYKEISKIVLVEIDPLVVKVCQEFFPHCTSGLSDPRVQVISQDGSEYVQKTTLKFDIIIIDSTDPENFASGLFTQEFYGRVKNILNPNGVVMAQTENPFLDTYNIADIYKNMRSQFAQVHSLSAPLLIYPGVFWTFAFCSNNQSATVLNQQRLSHMEPLLSQLKWYNPAWHVGAFQISNFHKRKIGL